MTKKTTNLSKDQTVREARVALAKKVIDNLNEARDPRRRDNFDMVTGAPLSRNAGIAQRDASNKRWRAEGRTGGPQGAGWQTGREEAGRKEGAWSLKGRRGAKGPRGKPKPSSFPKGRDQAAEKAEKKAATAPPRAGGDASLFRKAGRRTGEFLTKGKTGEFLNKVKGAASPLVKAGRRTGEVIDKVSYPLVNPYKAGKKAGEVLSPLIRAGRQVKDNAKAAGRMVSREGGYLKGALSQVKDNAKAGGRMVRKAVNKIPGMRKSPAATTAPAPAATTAPAPAAATPKATTAPAPAAATPKATTAPAAATPKATTAPAASSKPAAATTAPAPAAPAPAAPAPKPAAATAPAAPAPKPATPSEEKAANTTINNITNNPEAPRGGGSYSGDRRSPKGPRQPVKSRPFPRGRRSSDGAGGNTALAKKASTDREADQRLAKRMPGYKAYNSSTEIIRNSRMALAEKVLERLAEEENKVRKVYGTSKRTKSRAGLINRIAAVKKEGQAKKKGTGETEPKNKKSDVLMRAGSSSSNHPDYLKKKLYNRDTKDGGYGKEGDTTGADTIKKSNQRGLTNKSPARQKRWDAKQQKLAGAPAVAQRGKDYAKGEYEDSMSKDTTWDDDEDNR